MKKNIYSKWDVKKVAAIIESTDDAIIGKTLKGIITSWNPGATRLYGYKEHEVLGRSLKIIIPRNKKTEFENILEVIKLGGSVDHLETIRCHKDGHLIDVSITASPIKDGPQIIGASTISRDISEYKELERRQDAFISMTSHELKTPLTTLKAFTQVLQKRFEASLDSESQLFLDKIDQQVDRLNNLVSGLLNLSKIQSGKLALDKQPFDLNELIKETIENIRGLSQKHSININGRIKQLVLGDRDRIGQVLVNLLSNAIKYSPHQSQITIELLALDHKVAVKVTDFGIGIAKKNQPKVFDRFFRASGSSEKTFPGLGIGLYISSEIIKRHGGQIGVTSKKGRGSTFFFSLPIK